MLDATCGSATYGRRVAAPGCEVYGIDISMIMMHVLEIFELEFILPKTGFEHFQPQIMGSGILLQVEKADAAGR